MIFVPESIVNVFLDVVREINLYAVNIVIDLILVGGTSVVVKYKLNDTKRPYTGGLGDILVRKCVNIIPESIVDLQPDYENKLELLIEDGCVRVFIMSGYGDATLSCNMRKLTKKPTLRYLKKLADRLTFLTTVHEFERKKRFEPFLYLVQKEMGYDVNQAKHEIALAVASYVIDNSLNCTEYDMEFLNFLQYVVSKYGSADYLKYVDQMELPCSDYAKAVYDLRLFQS